MPTLTPEPEGEEPETEDDNEDEEEGHFAGTDGLTDVDSDDGAEDADHDPHFEKSGESAASTPQGSANGGSAAGGDGILNEKSRTAGIERNAILNGQKIGNSTETSSAKGSRKGESTKKKGRWTRILLCGMAG